MKDLINKTIAKIKKQKIKPEARWKFLIRKYGTWTTFFIVVIFAAIVLAATFEIILQLDWDVYRFSKRSPLHYFFSILPYIWFSLLMIFVTLAFLDLRKTENGYKFSWLKMIITVSGLLIIIGTLFFLIGFGKRSNDMLAEKTLYGSRMLMTKESQWMKPKEGFLAGEINEINNRDLEIRDLNGQRWKVIIDNETIIMSMAKVEKGQMIKIVGRQSGENLFKAIQIRPWMGNGRRGLMHNKQKI